MSGHPEEIASDLLRFSASAKPIRTDADGRTLFEFDNLAILVFADANASKAELAALIYEQMEIQARLASRMMLLVAQTEGRLQ